MNTRTALAAIVAAVALLTATGCAVSRGQETVGAYIDDREIGLEGLMEHVQGPDFPGGGIMDPQNIREAYATGRGSVRVRGKVHSEPLKGGKDALIVTELPYTV